MTDAEREAELPWIRERTIERLRSPLGRYIDDGLAKVVWFGPGEIPDGEPLCGGRYADGDSYVVIAT